MKFISPSVKWWPQDRSVFQHIARVGRICYKSKGKRPNPNLTDEERNAFIEKRDLELCRNFWQSGHRSMFRHATAYYFIKNQDKLPKWIWNFFTGSPYILYTHQQKHVWISTNMHFLTENGNILDILEPYAVSEQQFIDYAIKEKCHDALMLLRMTLVVTTQRIQGESYNRKSPNNIAEQSTRYVNLNKKGGVLICRPHWEKHAKWYQMWASHFGYWVAEKVYQFLLRTGIKPEDARGNLTFNTYTICAYTYNLHEWRHIIDMRLRNTTGKAHPDARIVAEDISRIINHRMQQYIPDFTI